MNLDYVIVQAGGKGTRMESLTKNKPKALVPINNRPLLFHLFKQFPDKKFIIIGDYKYDVLVRYLDAFADVDYDTVCSTGCSGTCSGLHKALSRIPDNKSFMLIWCDLLLSEDYCVPQSENNIIGLSKGFPCRWKYENNTFAEERSSDCGVAGLFIFRNKSYLADVPESGEFVRWLQSKNYVFEAQYLTTTREYGCLEACGNSDEKRCRPFNKMKIVGDKFYKAPVDEQGRSLAVREQAWYRKIRSTDFDNIPEIFSYSPLCMEYIKGKNIYECADESFEEKCTILKNTVQCLKKLHALGETASDRGSYYEAYLGKTFDRLEKIRELVPFAKDKSVTVNGRTCRNVFYHRDVLEEKLMQYLPEKFRLIHGDCTFSNIILNEKNKPVLIDPRGYFGNTELFGDEAYDWVKLYYSLFGNYDQFNLKRFNLEINEQDVTLSVKSNNWEALEDYFFELVGDTITKEQIRLLHAIVWLSLTTYAWEDYDSVCAAFYNGLYYLEEALQ